MTTHHNDWPVLRAQFAGAHLRIPQKAKPRPPCIHLGKVIGETPCKSCAANGETKLEKLHGCRLRVECTITRQSIEEDVACCRSCDWHNFPLADMPPAPAG